MAQKKRETILAAVTGGLLLVLAVIYLFSGGEETNSLDQLRQQRNELDGEVKRKRLLAKSLKKYAVQLAVFQERSLPSDRDRAHTSYQEWLRELVSSAGFNGAKVTPSKSPRPVASHRKFRYSVQGRGTLSQLTEFLFGFYSADHLHKITNLSASPVGDSKDLTLAITIEALSLPGARFADEKPRQLVLSTKPGNRLELPKLEEYSQVIVGRKMEEDRFVVETGGLFASYVPPRPDPPPREDPPPKPEPPGFDESKHAYVTATLEVDGKPQVWIDIRTSGKKLKLREGDLIELGPLSGIIVQIDPRQRFVIIEVDGKRHTIELGDNLQRISEESGEAA